MVVEVVPDYEAMSIRAAQLLALRIRELPTAVVGYATGSTPIGMYKELIRMHREDGLDFSRTTTFNLDEYVGLAPNHNQSYHWFMYHELFSHVNIDPSRIHIPDGVHDDLETHCVEYEEEIINSGGIDTQILGIGVNGHLGFNEPGSSLGSRTRIAALTEDTVKSNARFFNHVDDVPKRAITMGIATIMAAKTLVLLASGQNKAAAIQASLEGPVTAMMPASIVQFHPDVRVIIDEAAASQLNYSHHNGIAEPKA